MFWAPKGKYDPCGMFTGGHILILSICLLILIILLYYSQNMSKAMVRKLTRILALTISILETIKIVYSFYYGYTWLDSWLPIAFCSMFLYSLWLSGFSKNMLQSLGDAYLSGAALIAGAAYLICPSTSLMLYPVWHYQCIYSMVYHTSMIYVGYIYITKLKIRLNLTMYVYYLSLLCCFLVPSLILNNRFSCNLMQLREPFKSPFVIIDKMYETFPAGYTILVIFVYIVVPYGLTLIVYNLFNYKHIKSQQNHTIN